MLGILVLRLSMKVTLSLAFCSLSFFFCSGVLLASSQALSMEFLTDSFFDFLFDKLERKSKKLKIIGKVYDVQLPNYVVRHY
jgi:hypothetical protein